MNGSMTINKAANKSIQRHYRRLAARGDGLARVRFRQLTGKAWLHPARIAQAREQDRLDRAAHLSAMARTVPSRRQVTSHVCECLTLAEVA